MHYTALCFSFVHQCVLYKASLETGRRFFFCFEISLATYDVVFLFVLVEMSRDSAALRWEAKTKEIHCKRRFRVHCFAHNTIFVFSKSVPAMCITR